MVIDSLGHPAGGEGAWEPVTRHFSARWPEQGSQMVLRLPWPLCHLVKQSLEDGGDAYSCRGAGIPCGMAGWDHWPLVGSPYPQFLR